MVLRKFFCSALLLILFVSSNVFSSINFFGNLIKEDEIQSNIDDLEKIYRFASDNYLYEIDHKKVYEAMAAAMLDAFGDKWTQYINSEVSKRYGESIQGSFSGIGVYLTKVSPGNQKADDEKTLYLQIESVFKDGPAAKAGLKSGDLITHINSESVIEKTGTECSTLLRGKEGTTVTVTVKRKTSIFDIVITREIVNTPSVETEMLDNNILYMNINSFASNTSTQVINQLSQYAKRINGLIIDIRDNGGGDVNTCLEIADLFIDGKRPLISTDSKVVSRKKTYMSTNSTIISKKVPIVILVNNGSASASEILAAAMKDNNRATIIGEKTYGKGVMQISSPYKDGYVNVTTAEYKTPNGDKVHEVGIEPDIYVQHHPLTDEETDKLLKLHENGVVNKFVEENPELNSENFKKCLSLVRKDNEYDIIATELVEQYILAVYSRSIPNEKRRKAYPEYDPALNKAEVYIKEQIGLGFLTN